MLTKEYESMIKLHIHNCYRKKIAERFYAIFVRNVNIKNVIQNLVKENEFL